MSTSSIHFTFYFISFRMFIVRGPEDYLMDPSHNLDYRPMSRYSRLLIQYIGSYHACVCSPKLCRLFNIIHLKVSCVILKSYTFHYVFYIHVTVHRNQPDAPIFQIYSAIKLIMFRASSLPIIRSFLVYIRHC